MREPVTATSVQPDAAARLEAIEKELEIACGLGDLEQVRSILANCMQSLRDEVTRAGRAPITATQRRRDRFALVAPGISGPDDQPFTDEELDVIQQLWDSSRSSASTLYVAAFKLQRAEQLRSRFGEGAAQQMLFALGKGLKEALGPSDRLLPWKRASYVMLIHSMNPVGEIRSLLGKTIIRAGMQSIDVGGKSATLAVRADWTILPQSAGASLEAAISEVHNFLASTIQDAGSATPGR